MAVYRTALAAIDNAEAIPLAEEHRAGAIELSALGVGRTEAERRPLTLEEEIDISTRGPRPSRHRRGPGNHESRRRPAVACRREPASSAS